MRVPKTWIRMIPTFNGSGDIGLPSWWLDRGGVSELLDLMEIAYVDGYRNLMLPLPGGTVGHPMKYDQWERLGHVIPGRREELAKALLDWQTRRYDTRIWIYMGWPPGYRDMIREVSAWVGCGITGFGLDWASHSAVNIAMAQRYHDAMGRAGIEIMGEAIPRLVALRGTMRWFGLARYHARHDPDRTWRGPRIGVGVSGHKMTGWVLTHEMLVDHFRRHHFAVVYGKNGQWHRRAISALKEAKGYG